MKTKKAMKKITIIGMAALVAMGMLGTSCNKVESQEMETPATPKDNIVTLTTTVGFAEADTKALAIDYTAKTLTKTFKAGEQVVLTYEDQDGNNQNTVSQALTDEDISADGKSAKLTFALTNHPKADGSITYKYPASMLEDNGHPKTSYFFAQNGTLTDVATRDYAEYDGSFAGTNLPTSATLDNEIAVVAFTLYKSDGTTDITNTITGMTIEVGGVTYTITPSGLDKIYVAMWPEGGSEIITITATDGSKNYTKTLTGKTYNAGEFYQQGLKMAAAATARPLAEATTDDLGKIAGADGNIYDTKAAAEAAGTQAVAMIAYVGSKTDNFAHMYGFAIALSDEGGMTWSTAKSTCEGKTAVSGAVWLLPSQEQWKAMFKAFGGNEGSYTGLNTALATAGDELKKDGSYWSSTPYDGGRAWFVRLIDAKWKYDYMDYSLRVRACLVFGDYTARPLAEATTDDLGKIAGADGYIFDTKAAAEAAGTQAVAMIAYVGSETGDATYNHGLAIALADESGSMIRSTAKSTCEGKNTSLAVTGGTWMLPSQDQWKQMFKANGGNEGSYTGLNTAITTAGGTTLRGGNDYWSSSEYSPGVGPYYVVLNNGSTSWYRGGGNTDCRVRACLAF